MIRRPIISLLIAEAVSMTGSRVSVVAVPWLVLITTDSPTRVGVVTFAQALPFVFASLLGGPLVDRLGARRTAIAADSASAVTIAIVPLLYAQGALSFGWLLAVVTVSGALGGCGETAKRALLPRVIEASGMTMSRGTALYDGVNRSATLLGLPLAGVLIAAMGAAPVLIVDAASFALGVVVLVAGIRPSEATVEGERPHEPYGAALKAGLSYFRKDGLVAAILVMLFVTNLLDQAYNAIFVPVWVRDAGAEPIWLGLLGGAFGLGAVLGNIVYTALANRLPRHMTFAVCFLLAGSPRFFAMNLSDSTWLVLLVAFGAGLAIAAVNPILFAVGYERIPPHMQGRVFGAIGALAWAGIPLGSLAGGIAVDTAGLRITLLVAAGLYLAMTLVPFLVPRWRELDQKPENTPAEAVTA
ncbi:MFS transporter [Actinoplanes sp. NPDC051346]|uniref:MFS transporter n=1 Tax=Actinoplanes sp. NPDC051346 TaxID=3155048 RepID=UPI00342F95C8